MRTTRTLDRHLPALLCCLIAMVQPAAAQNSYQTVGLGEEFGYFASAPNAIASNGTVLADNYVLLNKQGIEELPPIPGFGWTIYNGVNASGTTTGTVFAEDFSDSFAFVRRPNGNLTIISVPGGFGAGGNGINDRGDVVGTYLDFNFNTHGFVADARGIRNVDFPGAVVTAPAGINSHGDIVGFYYDENFNAYGFVLDRNGYRQVTVPGTGVAFTYGINSRGQVAGGYLDGDRFQGMVLSDDQVSTVNHAITGLPESLTIDWTDFGYGVATYYPSAPNSVITGINDRGDVVGQTYVLFTTTDPDPGVLFLWIDSFIWTRAP